MSQNLPARIAARYLARKTASGDFAAIVQRIQAVQNLAGALADNIKLVEDLLAAGERRRLGRVHDINVGPIQFDGQRVIAKVAGTTGSYDVRITVAPKRGHHCTCPDWDQNGRRVGPCKHVMALGLAWQNEKLLPAVEGISDGLADILQRWG